MTTPLPRPPHASFRHSPQTPLMAYLYAASRGSSVRIRQWQTSWYEDTDGANPSQERMSVDEETPAEPSVPSLIARLAGAVPHFDEEAPAALEAQDRGKRSAKNEASACPTDVLPSTNDVMPRKNAPPSTGVDIPRQPEPEPVTDKEVAVEMLRLLDRRGNGMACHGAPNMNASSVFDVSNRTLFFPIGLE